MSVFPCSVCRQRRPGKLANLYWAWFDAMGSRVAYKQRLCFACAPTEIGKLLEDLRGAHDSENAFACLLCGASAQHDSDPVYLTLYLPGKEPEELAIQLDAACAVKIRIQAERGSERLADRGGLVRGPSQTITAWDALGLAPN